MVKMKNVSDFRQAITVSGTRVLMMPDDVIELSKLSTLIWLEEVPENTPITITPSRRVVSVSDLQEKINELKENTISASREELDEIKQSIQSSSEIIKPLEDEIHQTHGEVGKLAEDFESFKNIVHRRLEMMRGALMTLQQDFYDIEFDENGRMVDKDDTKS